MKRLYCGVFVVVENTGFVQNVNADNFIDWHNSPEEALGSWFQIIRIRHPKGTISHHYVEDITDIAKKGVSLGAYA